MKANFYLTGNDEIHDVAVSSMYQGCPIEKEYRDVKDYEPSDVAVVFGVYKKAVPFSHFRGYVIEKQKEHGGKTIVLETGYIKRGDGASHYYAAGFNGLNGRADFRNERMPRDRWDQLGVEMKPWRTEKDGVILVAGQVPWDASVQSVNFQEWLNSTICDLRKQTSREIIFRPHPKHPIAIVPGIETSMLPLEQDLARAWALVTFNSNTCVDATLAGVPAIVRDRGAMTWSLGNFSVYEIENPRTPDRQEWANSIAYAQWTLDEMRRGLTWAHLFRN